MKKQSNTLNTAFLFASGLLIVYVVSRFTKKKQAIPTIETGYKPTPVLPSRTSLSFDEIYQLLRKEEGFNATAQADGKDRNGNTLYSIGLGHQIQPGEEDLLTRSISEDEAINLFAKDITQIQTDMNKNIKVELNKNQQLALISLRYRIGPNYFNTSTLLKELNKRNFQKASEEFKNWRLSGGQVVRGLIERAERERVRFLTPPMFTGTFLPPAISPLSTQSMAPKFFPQNIPYTPTKAAPGVIKPPFRSVPYFPFFLPNF